MQVLRFESLPVQEWCNGQGSTRELDSSPVGPDFDWRISIADVDSSGPFSSFPDVDRCIVVCQGSAMALSVDGRPHSLITHEPFWFAGEATTTCTIGAEPTRDLNVMVRRGRCAAEVGVIAGSALIAGPTVFVIALSDTDVLDPSGSVIATLAPLDALSCDASVRLPEHAHAIVVRIRRYSNHGTAGFTSS